MTKTYHGTCACGAVHIEAAGTPVAELHCQCTHCRRRSGTGHSSFLVFNDPASVTITGETTRWSVKGDSGNEKYQSFCPICGSPTHVTFAADPGITAISPGFLDSAEDFAPRFVTYASRALSWDHIDPTLTRFDKLPIG